MRDIGGVTRAAATTDVVQGNWGLVREGEVMTKKHCEGIKASGQQMPECETVDRRMNQASVTRACFDKTPGSMFRQLQGRDGDKQSIEASSAEFAQLGRFLPRRSSAATSESEMDEERLFRHIP